MWKVLALKASAQKPHENSTFPYQVPIHEPKMNTMGVQFRNEQFLS